MQTATTTRPAETASMRRAHVDGVWSPHRRGFHVRLGSVDIFAHLPKPWAVKAVCMINSFETLDEQASEVRRISDAIGTSLD